MKKYLVRIPPEVQFYLRHLPPPIKAKIRKALEEIQTNPHFGKPLKEPLEGLRSYRVSQYRIIYQIQEKDIIIEVIKIAERKIVYQKISALLKMILKE